MINKTHLVLEFSTCQSFANIDNQNKKNILLKWDHFEQTRGIKTLKIISDCHKTRLQTD